MSQEAPQRIQLSRKKGWRMPPNTVKVDRSTKWGNPFCLKGSFLDNLTDLSLDGCIKIQYMWRSYVESNKNDKQEIVKSSLEFYESMLHCNLLKISIENVKRELKGKNLACWCKPGEPCHADILLKIANEP